MGPSLRFKLLNRQAIFRHQYASSSPLFCFVPFKRPSPSPCVGRLRHFSNVDKSTTASQLKELRKLTGSPIVDCKKALSEMEGNIQKAVDWLRQHGTAKASKKLSDREAENGLVACAVAEDGKSASIVKISSETDFAAKTDNFVKLACYVASDALNSTDNASGLSKSVQAVLDEAIVAIRENLAVNSTVRLTTTQDNGVLVSYVHAKVDSNHDAGLAAAIVELSGSGVINNPNAANDAGKKVAMHIVAARPTYLDVSFIPEDIIDKEKEILRTQIADLKKPPEIIEKIIDGKMKKFYSNVCLNEQEHMVEDSNLKVSEVLKDQGLTVSAYEFMRI